MLQETGLFVPKNVLKKYIMASLTVFESSKTDCPHQVRTVHSHPLLLQRTPETEDLMAYICHNFIQ